MSKLTNEQHEEMLDDVMAVFGKYDASPTDAMGVALYLLENIVNSWGNPKGGFADLAIRFSELSREV